MCPSSSMKILQIALTYFAGGDSYAGTAPLYWFWDRLNILIEKGMIKI
jgi:hypothetical protein